MYPVAQLFHCAHTLRLNTTQFHWGVLPSQVLLLFDVSSLHPIPIRRFRQAALFKLLLCLWHRGTSLSLTWTTWWMWWGTQLGSSMCLSFHFFLWKNDFWECLLKMVWLRAVLIIVTVCTLQFWLLVMKQQLLQGGIFQLSLILFLQECILTWPQMPPFCSIMTT